MNTNPKPLPPKTVRPKQAAYTLGISRALLYKLLAQKKLESVKVGRARLIKISSIEKLINS
jgi:excisionase family DNA binding protein